MDYKSTLNLPQTDFPMKAGLSQQEPLRVEAWKKDRVYERMIAKRKDKKQFVLHDGPPYANGNIHVGHTLNKILKDIVIKYKNMSGYHAEYIPGWDCHGLPIELGVEKQLKELKKEKSQMGRVEVRQLCRAYARGWIDRQREQFQRLGCFGDWDNPYLTLSDNYTASINRELGRITASGALYRGNKPVYWCPNCATALAEAEIEYAEHTSPSIYVKFELDALSAKKLNLPADKKVYLVIWTTTPWTLPANLGLAVNPTFDYETLDTGTELLIVAQDLRKKFIEATGVSVKEGTEHVISGSVFEGLKAHHPFLKRTSLVILADHVTLEAGTGIVHTAPGHGMEDYIAGKKYGLEAYSPVDAQGRYTGDVPEYEGMKAFDCNKLIGERMALSGHLIKLAFIKHSYAHCWRCHGPVMYRATPQWFIGMDMPLQKHGGKTLRELAVTEIHATKWVPQWGVNRILAMVEGRPDWCVSRQRVWGVPITIFYCEGCGDAITDPANFEHIANLVDKHGPDIWYEWDASKLMPEGIKCGCGCAKFTKETDILDVWFDSGVSHAAVLDSKFGAGKVSWPADLYLEGSDQHRGWFQTSLITAVATRGKAPFKTVLTHGFVNDAHGKKMSKSKGNVTDPMEFASKQGAEILRLWVVLEDYRNDVNFSLETIERIGDGYRRIRNTFRYMLGNLYDFDPAKDTVADEKLMELDRWALGQTAAFLKRLRGAYENYEYHTAYHELVNFCSSTLSALYFDILKDRLYTAKKNAIERRSSQTVLHRILTSLVTGLAPIMSFTCEEVWAAMKGQGSVFEQDFPAWGEDPRWESAQTKELVARMELILTVRGQANKKIEEKRANKEIGHPLEARLSLKPEQATLDAFAKTETNGESIARLLLVSKIDFDGPSAEIVVTQAEGTKCGRCWTYTTEVGQNQSHPELCGRCVEAIS